MRPDDCRTLSRIVGTFPYVDIWVAIIYGVYKEPPHQ